MMSAWTQESTLRTYKSLILMLALIERVGRVSAPRAETSRLPYGYSTAFTIDSMTFFASPKTIIVFGM